MEINAVQVGQKYDALREATQPSNETGGAFIERAFKNFATTLAESEAEAKNAMTGDADPHALVEALAQTELAVETAVTVRNKVVEAYQEILRMPV